MGNKKSKESKKRKRKRQMPAVTGLMYNGRHGNKIRIGMKQGGIVMKKKQMIGLVWDVHIPHTERELMWCGNTAEPTVPQPSHILAAT